MNKKFKKFCSLALAAVMLTVTGATVSADSFSGSSEAVVKFKLPCFFSNCMMFQQNKDMNLWGKAQSGSSIEATLFKGTSPVEKIDTTATSDNTWSMSFSPREGSFDRYSIIFSVDGNEIDSIDDILIGELWIGSGQSNMQLSLASQIDHAQIIADAVANEAYSNIRILDASAAMYGGGDSFNGMMFDTIDHDSHLSRWGYGNVEDDIKNISAYGMLTTFETFNNLNVPVGFINATIGSTGIEAWLSRDAINSNQEIVDVLKANNAYRETDENLKFDVMTGSWNFRLGPLSGMNVAGFLWYQGCSNMEKPLIDDPGFYENCLDAFIQDLAEKFNFDSADDMPFIVSQLAADYYKSNYADDEGNVDISNVSLPQWCAEVQNVVSKYSLSQQITFYDADLIFRDPSDPNDGNGPDHPRDKRTLSHRTAQAMLHNVYKISGTTDDYYIPEVKSYEVKENGHIVVTFLNVGEGLSAIGGGDEIEGFTVCGANRIFASARAKVIAANKVEVWNSLIPDAVDFTYAYTNFNMNSDLCNSYGLPALQYRSNDTDPDSAYTHPNDFLSCDHTNYWDSNRGFAKYTDDWKTGNIPGVTNAEDSTIAVDTEVFAQGQGSIRMNYTNSSSEAKQFSAGPCYDSYWCQVSARLERYNTITVLVKNPDDREKTLKLMVRLGDGSVAVVAPGKAGEAYNLPANSDFLCYSFDLNKLTDLNGNAVEKSVLSGISDFEFVVSDNASGSVYLDYIELGFEDAAQSADRIAAEETISAIPAVDTITSETVDTFKASIETAEKAVEDFMAKYPEGYVGNVAVIEAAKKALDEFNVVYGDVDASGKVDSNDALSVLQYAVRKTTLDEKQLKAADVNLDNSADSADALIILQYTVGKVTELPLKK